MSGWTLGTKMVYAEIFLFKTLVFPTNNYFIIFYFWPHTELFYVKGMGSNQLEEDLPFSRHIQSTEGLILNASVGQKSMATEKQ